MNVLHGSFVGRSPERQPTGSCGELIRRAQQGLAQQGVEQLSPRDGFPPVTQRKARGRGILDPLCFPTSQVKAQAQTGQLHVQAGTSTLRLLTAAGRVQTGALGSHFQVLPPLTERRAQARAGGPGGLPSADLQMPVMGLLRSALAVSGP